MTTDKNTLLRHWQMLRNIPRYPGKITATQLKEKLDKDEFDVSKRTVERDLLELSSIFPLMRDDRNKPYGWSWQKNAPAFNVPGLDRNEALALLMLEQYLVDLLPGSTLDVIDPYFKAAHLYLNDLSKGQKITSWTNKVRVVTPNQPLLKPKINRDIQRTVAEALLLDRQLKITYRKPDSTSDNEYRLHPLALVERGGIIYLVVKMFDYDNIRSIVLHRIQTAEMLYEASEYPTGFNIDEEITKGLFGFGSGGMIEVAAKFGALLGQRLVETPLSADQKVEKLSDQEYLITANVADTPQLLWWLLSLGVDVEVLEPTHLRQKLHEVHLASANKYQ